MSANGARCGSRMDKWLRIIWLVNGIALLILFGSVLKEAIESWLPNERRTPRGPIVGGQLEKAKADTVALQDIRSTIPWRIGRTNYSYITLSARDLTKPVPVRQYAPRSAAVKFRSFDGEFDDREALSDDDAINIIFMSDDGTDVRLLLHEKGAIVGTDIPSSDDSTRCFSIYRIVFRDTDGDGRLTSADREMLYISDLDGRNLRPLLPDSVDVKRAVGSFRDNEIFVVCAIRSRDPKVPKSDWGEIIYRYDALSQKLSPLLPDDKLMNEARRILQTK